MVTGRYGSWEMEVGTNKVNLPGDHAGRATYTVRTLGRQAYHGVGASPCASQKCRRLGRSWGPLKIAAGDR